MLCIDIQVDLGVSWESQLCKYWESAGGKPVHTPSPSGCLLFYTRRGRDGFRGPRSQVLAYPRNSQCLDHIKTSLKYKEKQTPQQTNREKLASTYKPTPAALDTALSGVALWFAFSTCTGSELGILSGWIQVRAGESTRKREDVEPTRAWLGEAGASGTEASFSLDLPTLISGRDLRQKGAFVRDCLFYSRAWGLLPVGLSKGCLSVLMKSIQTVSRIQTLEKALVLKPCLL